MEKQPFDGYLCFDLVAVPRPPAEASLDPTPSQLFAALTAAHATLAAGGATGKLGGEALCFCWLRPPGSPHLQFVAGGRPYFPPAADAVTRDDRTVGVRYPPGARGRMLSAAAFAARMESFSSWIACRGHSDSLWAGTDGAGRPRRGSFDDHVAHLHAPFAWLVVARPLPQAELDRELRRIANSIPELRAKASVADKQVEADRAEARFRELSRSRAGGLWDIDVLVGATSTAQANAAAALLCSASELDGLPYALVPAAVETAGPFAAVATGDRTDGVGPPFRATAELLAALTRPPACELPGIRLVSRHKFDVTPDLDVREGFRLGTVLDRAWEPAGEFTVPVPTLNRHSFVCGATGSGKSQTVRSLLEMLATARDPVPWLVIEPAKAEYARMAGRLPAGSVTVIRPADPAVAPASLNPLEPEPGFPLQGHLDLVRALFLAAFEVDEPFPQVLSRALTEAFTEAGWDLVTGRPRPAHRAKMYVDEPDRPVAGRYPTLHDLQLTARRVVERIGYGDEVTADVRGFVEVRLGSLREGAPGRFFEGGHPLDVAGVLAGNVVLELESITHDQDKAFLIGTVLVRIVEHLRVNRLSADHNGVAKGGGLRHVTVVEEAHRLLKNITEGPAAGAVELFASLLAEIRAYGEGVVVVEQIPSKIIPDVLKNTALKIMHRLPAADDREAVGGTMNLRPDDAEVVLSFPPGVAAVAVDGTDRPLLVRIPHDEERESAVGVGTRAPLAGSRSPLCSADCRTSPCTGNAMNEADHVSRHPMFVVWVESVVASCLMGFHPPRPSRLLAEYVEAVPRRLRECATTYAVERAVAARRALLRQWVDPDDFADHLLSVLTERLTGQGVDESDWRRWLAGPYRWQDVRVALTGAVKRGELAGAHPSTADWRRRGLHLDGSTVTEQLAQLDLHAAYVEDQETVVTGDVDVSRLRDAVVALTGATTPDRLARALVVAGDGPATTSLVPQLSRLLEVVAHAEGKPTDAR